MQQKIHMHDQVFNKVEDIMNHYKRKPIEGLKRLLKQFMKQSSVIWGRLDGLQRELKGNRIVSRNKALDNGRLGKKWLSKPYLRSSMAVSGPVCHSYAVITPSGNFTGWKWTKTARNGLLKVTASYTVTLILCWSYLACKTLIGHAGFFLPKIQASNMSSFKTVSTDQD